MTEGGTYITFSPYMEGMAPALIINHTENYLKFIEHDLSEYLDEMLVEKILMLKYSFKYNKMFFFFTAKYYLRNIKCSLHGLLPQIILLFIGT